MRALQRVPLDGLPQRFRAPFNQRRRPSGVGGVPVVF
jgi:hypothetical protein